MCEPRVIAVLKCPEGVDYFTETTNPSNQDDRWLLRNMVVRADREYGIELVNVAVLATEDGTLLDIKLNDKSIGYFAVRTFVKTLKYLKLPTLITHGLERDIDIEELCKSHDHGVYMIPLFGEQDECY